MRVDVNPDDVRKLNADNRGRVYLGTEFANANEIEVAVLNADELAED